MKEAMGSHPAPCKALVYCDCKNRGGVLTYTIDLIEALDDSGVNVILITHPPDGHEQLAILKELASRTSTVVEVPRGAKIKKQIKRFVEIIDEEQPEFFFPNYRASAFAACAALENSKTRCVGVCHNDAEDSYSVLLRYESVLSAFVCPSVKSYRVLQERLPSRSSDIYFIPHCVKFIERLPPTKEKPWQPFRLIYHGRIAQRQKQVLLLPELAEQLVAKQVSFHITIIGEGESKGQLESAIIDRGLQAYISVLPSMTWEELAEELPRHHVAVLTSAYEGFCYSVAEAMGLGLPAVAFDAGGVLGTYVQDGRNGYLFENGDLENMAQRIAELARSEVSYLNLSRAARATIESGFTREIFQKSYSEMLSALSHTSARNWPRIRPWYVDSDSGLILRVIETMGRLVGLWR